MSSTRLLPILFTAVATLATAAPPAPPAPSALPRAAPAMESDRNEDGEVDYLLFLDGQGNTEHEEFDFNFDGAMDDFYYYEKGVLVREEIDSDFDGKVDIWVYLLDGKYIERYERDLDGDGKPDQAKVFGPGQGP